MASRYASSPPPKLSPKRNKSNEGKEKSEFSLSPRAEPLTIVPGPRWAKRKDGGMEGDGAVIVGIEERELGGRWNEVRSFDQTCPKNM